MKLGPEFLRVSFINVFSMTLGFLADIAPKLVTRFL